MGALKCLAIAVVFGAVATGAVDVFLALHDVKDFNDYLAQTGKVYSDAERGFRETIFIGKKNVVDKGNLQADSGLSLFRMTINPLADLTRPEIFKLTGSRITPDGEEITALHTNFVTAKTNNNLPESVDWREKGGVTPAGFQGYSCGSCWSFATAACIEGHLYRRTGILVPISEQNLIDCATDYGNTGCDGGFQEYGFEYIRDHGISLANHYPYTQMMNADCHRNETGRGVHIRDYARIKPGDEEKMKEVLATLGPLACTVNAAPTSFQMYKGGIYDDNECNSEDVNHSVVVVGYGTENGRDYWIIKNSYSENWGENGFMRLLRNAGSFCGIANECSYPIL